MYKEELRQMFYKTSNEKYINQEKGAWVCHATQSLETHIYGTTKTWKTGLEAAERPTAALGELQEFLASNGRVLNGL